MNYYKQYFDQPTINILAQIKFLLRILQSQGFDRRNLTFLLTMETILEKGDTKEPLRTKLLPLLQTNTETE
jgi:hypothetical protein